MKATKKLVNKYLPKIIGLRLNSLFRINPDKALLKAYKLFSSPRKGKVKPEQVDFLDQAKTTPIEHDSKKIQTYHWKGSGDTIILVHGWDSNTHRWKNLVEKLQNQNYNIVAFDAPAHGYSEGKLLNVPLYSLCLDRMLKLYKPKFIVGHSMGGMTLVYNQYLKQSPFIEKMILLGAPSEMSLIMSDYKRILRLSDKFMKALDAYFKNKFGYQFHEFSIANFAKAVEIESLIIHDAYDKVAPVEAGKNIHKNLKNSRLSITEGAGHSLNKDHILDEILDFLKP
jgi:pimeloyl-ACP methyl ester carboxylesterase